MYVQVQLPFVPTNSQLGLHEWQSWLTGKGGHSDALQERGCTSSQSIIDTSHNGLT